jgi:hypothetical protein
MRHTRQRHTPKVSVPGFWRQLWERWRGYDTRTVDFSDVSPANGESSARPPLLVLRYPHSAAGREAADYLESACRQLALILHPSPLEVYADILPLLPPTVVVLMRERDPGGCLGHARLAGTESEFSSNLAQETRSRVGEIDLCWRLIAEWQPQPLASLAVESEMEKERELRYGIALLTVLFHEMEHLAFPDRPEAEVRRRSDSFYTQVLSAVLAEKGEHYGIETSLSRLP